MSVGDVSTAGLGLSWPGLVTKAHEGSTEMPAQLAARQAHDGVKLDMPDAVADSLECTWLALSRHVDAQRHWRQHPRP